MKKIFSLVLALSMVLAMFTSALAGTITYEADETVLKAGESLNIAVKLDEAIEDIIGLQYNLYFDAEKFTMTGSACGDVVSGVDCSLISDAKPYVNINWYDATAEGVTLNAGTLATVTFTANEDIPTSFEVQFELEKEEIVGGESAGYEPVNDGNVSGGPISVTVGTPAGGETVDTPFAGITYTLGDEESDYLPIREEGTYNYSGLWTVPLYVVTLPEEYDIITMYFDEEIEMAPTYADETGNMVGPWNMPDVYESYEIDFTIGDYFMTQIDIGGPYGIEPTYALTYETGEIEGEEPETYEMTDVIIKGAWSPINPISELENGIYQVASYGKAFSFNYEIEDMPDSYEVKDYSWTATAANGTTKTSKESIISGEFNAGLGSLELTIIYGPKGNNYLNQTFTKTVPLYLGSISTVLDKTEAALTVGETLTLTATHSVEATIVWTSSEESIATVENGVVTAVSVGTANITATANGKSAICAVTVEEAEEPAADVPFTVKVDGEQIAVEAIDDMIFYVAYPMGKEAVVTLESGSEAQMMVFGKYDIEGKISNDGVETHGMNAEEFNTYGLGKEIAATSTGLYLQVYDEISGNVFDLIVELTNEETEEPDAPTAPIREIAFWEDGAEEPISQIVISENSASGVDAIACCTPRKTDDTVVFASGNTEIFTISSEEVDPDESGYARTTVKGVKAGQATLTAVSKYNPEIKAELTVIVNCGHIGKETTSSTEYKPNNDGTHNAVITTSCVCGEVVSTTNEIEDCVDEDTDGACDKCFGEVAIPEVPATFVIYDSAVQGDWSSRINLSKLIVSGVKVKSYEWNADKTACIVTLKAGTASNAAITFSAEGISGGGGAGALYVNNSKSNYTVNLVDGMADVSVTTASKFSSGSLATTKTVSFITEGDEIVPVEQIIITPAEGRVEASGGSLQLSATVLPENATVKAVVWSTNADSTALTLTEDGKVIGSTMGMGRYYTMTATSKSNPEVSAECRVYLDYSREKSIVLDQTNVNLKAGETASLMATVDTNQFSGNRAVTWSSSDESVATVSGGKVTAIGSGTATITATSYYGLTAQCVVTVEECKHTDTSAAYEQIAGTETHTVTVTCTCGEQISQTTENCADEDENGACDKCFGEVAIPEVPATIVIYDSTVQGNWSNRINLSKLIVSGVKVKVKSYEWNADKTACIVTLKAGTAPNAAITFSAEGISGGGGNGALYVNDSKSNYTVNLVDGKADVKVTTASRFAVNSLATTKTISFITEGEEIVPVEQIIITPAEGRVEAGKSLQLTASVLPENATVKTVEWSTNADSTALTLTEDGKVIASTMGLGRYYTMTATSKSNPEVSAECRVYLDYSRETSIVLDQTNVSLKAGETASLMATVETNQFTGNRAVTWSSSDESVATVSGGKVTAIGSGTATITATSYYGLTAQCVVTVEAEECKHTDTSAAYEQIAGTETHTVTVTCTCGEQISQTTENCADEDENGQCDQCGGEVAVELPELSGLTAVLSGTTTVTEGETAQIELFVMSDDADETYNAFKFVVNYDSEKLEYTGSNIVSDAAHDYNVNAATEGKLVIDGYGDNRSVSAENALVTLNFKAKSLGDGEVTIAKAYANARATAANQDVQEIDIVNGTATVTVTEVPKDEYAITFTGGTVNGGKAELTVVEGDTLTFTLDNTTNLKSVNVSGGTLTDNGDGSYTISGVTADTNVTISYKATFTVSITGSGAADANGKTSVLEGDTYSFTVNKQSGYTYTVTATMGGQNTELTGSYEIANVTGNIVITVNNTAVVNPDPTDPPVGPDPTDPPVGPTDPPVITYNVSTVLDGGEAVDVDDVMNTDTEYTFTAHFTENIVLIGVTVDGIEVAYTDNGDGTYTIAAENGFDGDVVITYASAFTVAKPEGVTGEDTAIFGKDYTFTVEGTAKTPVVTIGGVEIEAVDNGDGTWTIPGDLVTGEIVVELPVEITVEVYKYFKIDGGEMKLVLATTDTALSDGKTLAYNGSAMFWSDAYNAYAWLVPAAEAFTADDAKANIAIAAGTAVEIAYTGDVNKTNAIDVNDAQLTYDLYNAQYANFTVVDMEKMLRADVVTDKVVDTQDTAAIVVKYR